MTPPRTAYRACPPAAGPRGSRTGWVQACPCRSAGSAARWRTPAAPGTLHARRQHQRGCRSSCSCQPGGCLQERRRMCSNSLTPVTRQRGAAKVFGPPPSASCPRRAAGAAACCGRQQRCLLALAPQPPDLLLTQRPPELQARGHVLPGGGPWGSGGRPSAAGRGRPTARRTQRPARCGGSTAGLSPLCAATESVGAGASFVTWLRALHVCASASSERWSSRDSRDSSTAAGKEHSPAAPGGSAPHEQRQLLRPAVGA
jgi:hypothetical protein